MKQTERERETTSNKIKFWKLNMSLSFNRSLNTLHCFTDPVENIVHFLRHLIYGQLRTYRKDLHSEKINRLWQFACVRESGSAAKNKEDCRFLISLLKSISKLWSPRS